MILKLLLNTQMISMKFIKILNIEEYNPNKKPQNIVFDIIADMLNKKKTWSNSNWIIYLR